MNIPYIQNRSIALSIEKSRLKQILNLSLPIAVAMFGFSSIGLIDIAMVGRLGDVALAALGIANSLFFLLFVIAMGLGTGVQTLTAMRTGEGNIHLAGYDLNAGLVLGSILGTILMILGDFTLPLFLSLMNQDSQVITESIAYLNTRLPQLLFFTLCFSFRSYWNGINMSKVLLLEMIVGILGNVFFNYLLIFGNLGCPRMGTAGAGLSTTITSIITFLVHFILAVKHARKNGFLRGLPEKERIKTLIRLSVPVSIGRFLTTMSVAVIFMIVGLLGTKETAAYNVITNIVMTVLLMADAMGFAAITFVGQSIGRKDIKDAKSWGWDIAKVGFGVLLVFGILMMLFSQTILSVFIIDQDTISIAVNPLRLAGIYVSLIGFCMIISSALIGAGAAKTSLKFALFNQWCLALPLQWLLGVHLGYGLNGVALGFLISHILGLFIGVVIWQRERWAPIKM